MTYTENLWLFLTLLFGIIIVPGMDMLFVLANSLTRGRNAGLSATAGIMTGGAIHTLFGALAVGILATLAPSVFTVMLFVGAGYMAWIGITLMRSSIAIDAVGTATARSLWVAFRQGAVTCLLNPKAYLFVLAVYPQFLKPQYGAIWSQALVMGVMTVLMQLGVYGGLALAAGRSRDFLVSSPQATMLAGRAAGAIFIVVAGLTAWHGWTASRRSKVLGRLSKALLAPAYRVVAVEDAHVALEVVRQGPDVERGSMARGAWPGKLPECPQELAGRICGVRLGVNV